MKCKIIVNKKTVPTFEDFEKIEEFEYDGIFKFFGKSYLSPDNACWVLNCENGMLYVRHSNFSIYENNVFWELGIINGYSEKIIEIFEDYDDEEITKDLMLDEVISSQHREIEKLEEIIKEFSNQNSKLTNIIETNSTIIKQQNEYIRILQTESQKILLNISNWLIKEQII